MCFAIAVVAACGDVGCADGAFAVGGSIGAASVALEVVSRRLPR